MSFGSWLLWGFAATLVLTIFAVVSEELRFTRVNLPLLLGTMVTPSRSRAKFYGTLIHFANGWVFSLLYVFAFQSLGAAGWWRGAIIGVIHAAGVLTVGMPLLPAFHPRMATEHHGPAAGRELEPPGMLAMHYGVRTPLTILFSHALYGAVLGAFYAVR